MIDLYRRVFGDKRQSVLEAANTWPGNCGLAAWDSVPHIQNILAAAREAGIPVVHFPSAEMAGVPGWQRSEATQPNALDPEEQERRKKGYEIIDEFAPVPRELVMLKSSPSTFWGTPLAGHFNRLGVDTIIVCGESTSGCVRASVVDGCTNRFRMIVVEEGVFDRHETTHAMNLFDMNQKYADVLPVEEVLAYLRSWHSQRDVKVAQVAAVAR